MFAFSRPSFQVGISKGGKRGPLSNSCYGCNHRPRVAFTSRLRLDRQRYVARMETPPSSTQCRREHTLPSDAGLRKGTSILFQMKLLCRHGRRRRRRFLKANETAQSTKNINKTKKCRQNTCKSWNVFFGTVTFNLY